jgi:hypothetical protein
VYQQEAGEEPYSSVRKETDAAMERERAVNE